MKMFWFFNATSAIPWAFKICGIFQMCCDLFLGVQYWRYGDGPGAGLPARIKDHMSPLDGINMPHRTNGYELGRRTPTGEKDVRLG